MAHEVSGNPPCRHDCPLNIDVPAFIARIALGKYREAFELIRAVNPFPITCGYICHHPCEKHCRAGGNGEPISIRALERFAGDYVLAHGFSALPQNEAPMLEKVAIIGAGPAGLSAAYQLARLGYQPTVFETSPVAGGRLALAVPEFRLPRRITELEVECIKQAGVNVLTNTPAGPNLTIDDLITGGFRAVLLAVGARTGLKLGLPDEDAPGVMPALSFLEAVRGHKPVSLGDWVAVIGGEDSAVDSARSARRLRSRDVSIIFPGTRTEMPANEDNIEAALEEGVKIVENTAPTRFIARNNHLVALECQTLEPYECDEKGKPRLVPIPGSEFIFPVDNAIVASGEQPDLSLLPEGKTLPSTNNNTIQVDPETFSTGEPGVFVAGRAVSNHFAIADSILSGKLAALSIHDFLRGKREFPTTSPSPQTTPPKVIEKVFERRRLPVRRSPAPERVSGFGLVELGYDERTAVMEARRCPGCVE